MSVEQMQRAARRGLGSRLETRILEALYMLEEKQVPDVRAIVQEHTRLTNLMKGLSDDGGRVMSMDELETRLRVQAPPTRTSSQEHTRLTNLMKGLSDDGVRAGDVDGRTGNAPTGAGREEETMSVEQMQRAARRGMVARDTAALAEREPQYGCARGAELPPLAEILKSVHHGRYRRAAIDLRTGEITTDGEGRVVFDVTELPLQHHIVWVGKGYELFAIIPAAERAR